MKDQVADKEIRKWFENHEASLCVLADKDNDKTIWWLRWKKPGTTIYWIDYMMTSDGRLMVTGDVGDAIYQWYLSLPTRQNDPLEFAADCDIGYFASKCVASEEGREYTQWFEEKAQVALDNWEDDGEEHEHGGVHRKDLLSGEADVEWYADLPRNSLATEFDWHEWLRLYGNEAFGEEWWRDWCDIGRGIHVRCRTHLIGLKMAMEQLKEKV